MRIAEQIADVEGFLSGDEVDFLYKLASEVPPGGNIVEIGSYRGKSTVALALGAKENGARVYAVDPHNDEQIDEFTHYGAENYGILWENLKHYQLLDSVLILRCLSSEAFMMWNRNFWGEPVNINLLWVDGSHQYEDVKRDFDNWSQYTLPLGIIALHDTAGHHPGVSQLVDEILAAGQWERVNVVDAISVFKRVK